MVLEPTHPPVHTVLANTSPKGLQSEDPAGDAGAGERHPILTQNGGSRLELVPSEQSGSGRAEDCGDDTPFTFYENWTEGV